MNRKARIVQWTTALLGAAAVYVATYYLVTVTASAFVDPGDKFNKDVPQLSALVALPIASLGFFIAWELTGRLLRTPDQSTS